MGKTVRTAQAGGVKGQGNRITYAYVRTYVCTCLHITMGLVAHGVFNSELATQNVPVN